MTEKKIAVKVDHVSKFFKLPVESTQSLRTALVNRFKGIKGYKEQHVLKRGKKWFREIDIIEDYFSDLCS